MKKLIAVLAVAAALSGLTANAQKFNPKVEVTNTYEGKVMEAQKHDLKMAVPDSLLRFQYNINYSVFDKAYKGSYEFQPYRIEMRPEPVPDTEKKFFVSLGAGYQLHPEGDLVFTPTLSKWPVTLTLYDRFRGFWGDLGSTFEEPANGFKVPFMDKDYVFDNHAGLAVRYEWDNMALDAEANYHLLSARDSLSQHFYQGGEGQLKLSPLNPAKAGYFYGAKLYVKAGKDDFKYPGNGYPFPVRHKTGVNNMGFEASFGTARGYSDGIVADVGMQCVINSGFLEASSTRLWIAPHYKFDGQRGFALLGAKVSYLTNTDRSHKDVYLHKSNIIYPDIRAKYFLVPDKLAVVADITGGDKINDYLTLLQENPFIDPYAVNSGLDNSSEAVNASFGFEGDLGRKFHFALKGGYVDYLNERCDAIFPAGHVPSVYPAAYYVYQDYSMYFGEVSFLYKSARVEMDGRFTYKANDLDTDSIYDIVLPAGMTGDFKLTYNWSRRAFLGFSVNAVSSREYAYSQTPEILSEGEVPGLLHVVRGKLPAYFDLGVHGHYVINPKWTLWAKSGNLLNQKVQTYLLRPERSPWCTLGISFNL